MLTASVLSQVAADYLAANPGQQGDAPGKQDRNDAALAWLTASLAGLGVTISLDGIADGIVTDGCLIGAVSAAAMSDGTGTADLGGWQPGDSATARDRVSDLGVAGALTGLPGEAAGQVAGRLGGGIIASLARTLAGSDGSAPVSGLAAALGKVVADGARSVGAVLAELYSAIAAAAKAFFSGRDSDGDLYQWLADPTLANCVICLDNAAAEPRAWGEPWPSGDAFPGIHVKCGCALVLVARQGAQ